MLGHGHTPVTEPLWLNNTVNLDTGSVFGGSLSALRYPEREVVSARAAHTTYYESNRPFRLIHPSGCCRYEDPRLPHHFMCSGKSLNLRAFLVSSFAFPFLNIDRHALPRSTLCRQYVGRQTVMTGSTSQARAQAKLLLAFNAGPGKDSARTLGVYSLGSIRSSETLSQSQPLRHGRSNC